MCMDGIVNSKLSSKVSQSTGSYLFGPFYEEYVSVSRDEGTSAERDSPFGLPKWQVGFRRVE